MKPKIKANPVLQEYWRQRVLKAAPELRQLRGEYFRAVADELEISYYTLQGKLRGMGRFTDRQIGILKRTSWIS